MNADYVSAQNATRCDACAKKGHSCYAHKIVGGEALCIFCLGWRALHSRAARGPSGDQARRAEARCYGGCDAGKEKMPG